MEDNQNSTSTVTEGVLQPPGAPPEVAVGAETPEPQPGGKPTPTPRVYTEAEWNKRQSAFDKQMAKAQARIKELEEAHARAEEQAREQLYSSWLKAIEDSGGDVDAAGKAIAGIKAELQRIKELQKKEAWIQEQAQLLSEAGKVKQAEDFISQYELDKDALEQLLEANDTTEMELKAVKLAYTKSKTKATPSTVVDAPINKAAPSDLTNLPPTVVLGRLLDEELSRRKR